MKQEIKEELEKSQDSGEMSRRSFLRKLGVGTVGLGALSLVPGSALNVRSDGFSFYGGSGSGLDFDIDNSGNVLDIGDFATGSAVNFQDGLTSNGNTVWHAGNDGSGSGLDADTLDGQEASELGGGAEIQRDPSGKAAIKSTTNITTSTIPLSAEGTTLAYSNSTRTFWNQGSGGKTTFTTYQTGYNTITVTIHATDTYADYMEGKVKIDGNTQASTRLVTPSSTQSITTTFLTSLSNGATLSMYGYVKAGNYTYADIDVTGRVYHRNSTTGTQYNTPNLTST